MKTIFPSISLTALLLFPNSAGCEAPANYCNDPEAMRQWRALLEKHPHDDAIAALHAMRVGLCAMVESGEMKEARATDIFEKMRESLVERYREQSQRTEAEEGA